MSDLNALITEAESRWVAGFGVGPHRQAVGRTGVGPGDQAPTVDLVDSHGTAVSLSRYWQETPALLIFWRHFGCGCGAERAARLADEREAIAAEGATVVIVGMGDPIRTAHYQERFGISEPFLCDPERRAYGAFGVPETTMLGAMYDEPDVLLGGPEAWRMVMDFKRDNDMHLVDNGWQLMSEFVIGTDGTIHSAYRYQYCDDFPDPRLALSAIKQAQAGLDPLRGSTIDGM